MSNFTDELDLRFLPDRSVAPLRDLVWEVRHSVHTPAGLYASYITSTTVPRRERWDIQVASKDPITTVTVPTGFACDGASIPFFLWPIVGYPLAPSVVRAALLHDWLYFAHMDDQGLHVSRREADKQFFDAMRADGVNLFRATTMWLGVRVGGVWAYRKNQPGTRINEQVVSDVADVLRSA